MKHTKSPKPTRQTTSDTRQDSYIGKNAISIAPPAYGMDFADRVYAATATSSPPLQLQGDLEEEELLQGKFATKVTPMQFQTSGGPAENRTGMPDQLKAGLEQLGGVDMSGVRVHYDSAKPAQLNALAYAQGQDIHLGPRQEKHLPHEGWHAVQQMQGRVNPTMQTKGVAINDDPALEREADLMGAKAATKTSPEPFSGPTLASFTGVSARVAQLTDVVEWGVNDDDELTQDKKIKTRNASTSWFRFPKDGNKIDTFEENETTSLPAGTDHVETTIDIADDAKANEYDIGWLSRPQHFAAGDRLAGIGKSYRKGKWTWHHKQDPYYMELVDMAVHKSFYHHGGFSKWQEGTDDDEDD